MSLDIHSLIRDALRYRELRKNRNRGYPQPGCPYVVGWQVHENDPESFDEIGHIRERELDDAMDDVLDRDGFDPDTIYNALVATGVIIEAKIVS